MSKIGSVAKSSEGMEELRFAARLTVLDGHRRIERFSKISKCAVASAGSALSEAYDLCIVKSILTDTVYRYPACARETEFT